MNNENELKFPVAGGSSSAPPGVAPPPVRAGGGDAFCMMETVLCAHRTALPPQERLVMLAICSMQMDENNMVGISISELSSLTALDEGRLLTTLRKLSMKGVICGLADSECVISGQYVVNIDLLVEYANPDFSPIKNDEARYQKNKKRLMGVLSSILKSSSTRHSAFVGCTPDFLRSHIESQFLPGMSWENRRRYPFWHIDHKIPCAAFNLRDKKQVRMCFHYTNLRPLWSYDNMKKGARI